MARAGATAAQQENQTTAANANTAFQGENAAINNYEGYINSLQNPYDTSTPTGQQTLQNLTLGTSGADSSANNAGAQAVRDTAARTGGNTASANATIRDLSRAKTEGIAQMNAKNQNSMTDNSLAYEQWLANAKLAPAQAYGGAYGTSIGGQSASTGDLVNEDQQNAAMWGNIIGGVAGGAGAAFQGKA